MSAVIVAGVSKQFRRSRPLRQALRHPFARDLVQALEVVSFTVEPGECFGLLGENGAGKSTLFRMLSTLVLPDHGRLLVHGTDVVASPGDARRLVAPVPPSERSLYWRLNARQNLELFAQLYRVPATTTGRHIAELLELVDLARAGTAQVGTFSSGMRQRLLLARALLPEPRVLLLDEPTRSLDPVGARAFRSFLKERVLGATRCTALIATHIPDEVRELCSRVAVLHRGHVVAQGRVSDLAARVAGRRWRLLTGEDPAGALARCTGVGEVVQVGPAERLGDNLWSQELELPSGDTGDLLARLVHTGVQVTGLERVEVPLADLLERLTRGMEPGVPLHA